MGMLHVAATCHLAVALKSKYIYNTFGGSVNMSIQKYVPVSLVMLHPYNGI